MRRQTVAWCEFCIHTREKLPLGIQLSVNLDPDRQLPAIRAQVNTFDRIGARMWRKVLGFLCLIGHVLMTGTSWPTVSVVRKGIETSTRRLTLQS